MNTITYKGKEYTTRTFQVKYEDGTHEITIADESLSDAIMEEFPDFDNMSDEAWAIDNQIYFYVEPEVINKSAEEICADFLDIEMQFVE